MYESTYSTSFRIQYGLNFEIILPLLYLLCFPVRPEPVIPLATTATGGRNEDKRRGLVRPQHAADRNGRLITGVLVGVALRNFRLCGGDGVEAFRAAIPSSRNLTVYGRYAVEFLASRALDIRTTITFFPNTGTGLLKQNVNFVECICDLLPAEILKSSRNLIPLDKEFYCCLEFP
ncbi:hypothetical protein Trydic_g12533 [Trypoxylus dichotomus]